MMARMRYWKITPEEAGALEYDREKLVNWEIKCALPDQSSFVGVFLYRRGTPFDYESVRGVCMYHNNVGKDVAGRVAGMLAERYGGKRIEKGERMFLKGSDEPYGGDEIGSLASAVESEIGGKAVISLEFEGATAEELAGCGMPEAKLLPIPGG